MPTSASPTRARPRHYGIVFSFFLLVLAPLALTIYYLFTIAHDQYASTIGFAVRSEEVTDTLGLLGGLASLSGTSSSDTDILYEFIQSQDMIAEISKTLDLRDLYSWPKDDPVFTLAKDAPIEDLVDYWQRMVKIDYSSGTGLIEVQVRAFRPEDAQQIARQIMITSTVMINDLSAIARSDATGYAKDELEQAVDRLKTARASMTQFRSQSGIIDPGTDLQAQMGLLSSLDAQLAAAYIERNLLTETNNSSDPRLEKANRRITVIENLIEEERQKFGLGDNSIPGSADYSALVGEFERLMVDREYAEQTYVGAQLA